MKPVVTLTLNPTIDGAASAEAIRPLHKIRTSEERYAPGGGGINVARVVRELGGDALAVYLSGGPTGKLLDELLAAAGLVVKRVPIAGYTRIAHTVLERASGFEYRFVPEGPAISLAEWQTCLAALAELDFDYIVVSGSLARGLQPDAYHQVLDIAAAKGARVILDTSGPALRATLERGVYVVKPSLGELESVAERPLRQPAEQEAAARDLIAAGAAEIVAVTLGGDGAMIVSGAGAWRLAAPPVVAKSAVGAGDSFVAALTMALIEGRPLAAALAYGVAAGTAAVLTPGHDLAHAADVERLFESLGWPAALSAGTSGGSPGSA